MSAGGKPIADADDLFDALGGLEPPFELGIVRGAEERTVTVARRRPVAKRRSARPATRDRVRRVAAVVGGAGGRGSIALVDRIVGWYRVASSPEPSSR